MLSIRWVLIGLFLVLFLFSGASVHAMGISPPVFELNEVEIDSLSTVSVGLVRNATTEPTGDITLTVSPRKTGAPYFYGDETVVIPDGEDLVTYSFNVIPDSSAWGTCVLYVDFIKTVSGSGSGVTVRTGATMTGSFTVAGTPAGDCEPIPNVSSGTTGSTSETGGGSSGGGSDSGGEDNSESGESSGGTDDSTGGDEEASDGELCNCADDESSGGDRLGSTEGQDPEEGETSSGSVSGSDVAEGEGDDQEEEVEDVQLVVEKEPVDEIPLVDDHTDADINIHIPLLEIYSKTHPVEEKWYPSEWVSVAWTVDGEVNPSETYEYAMDKEARGTLSSMQFMTLAPHLQFRLEDGTHFFHVARKREDGHSGITNFKINVDTTPPELFEPVIETKISAFANLYHTIFFPTWDKHSGMDTYQVYEDGKLLIETRDDKFELPHVSVGVHKYEIRAIDQVGNIREQSIELTIDKNIAHGPWLEGIFTALAGVFLQGTYLAARLRFTSL